MPPDPQRASALAMLTGFRPDVLAGKRILVTGGGSGLGAIMAEAYAGFGATVYICGRRPGVLESTAQEITGRTGSKVVPLTCDIRSADSVETMIERIWTDGGALTGLVNNAAGNFLARSEDLSSRAFDAVAATVFHGSFYVTLACGKRWIADHVPASVISILVTWVWNGGPFTVPSAMSKAGLHIMTKSLAAEWARYGIRLNAIAPGPFPTAGAGERLHPASAAAGNDGDRVPMGRVGAPHELANLAVFLMADGCDYLTGQTIAIDGANHIANGGNYARMSALGEAEWRSIREEVRAADTQDKARRQQ